MTRPRRLLAHDIFFPLACLWAAAAVPLWLALLSGWLPPPAWPAAPVWHAHEMLLGFAGATMAGFLVTRASPARILLLAALWGLARIAFWIPSPFAALLLLPFPALLAGLVAPPFLKASRKLNNLAFGVIPIGLLLLEGLFALAAMGAWAGLLEPVIWTLVYLVSALLTLMGGRIIRAATAGLVQKRGGRFEAGINLRREAFSLVLFLFAILATLLSLPLATAGLALLGAGLLTGWQLGRWFVPMLRRAPELWALHLGYAWLAAGLILLGLAGMVPALAAADVVHAAMIGGLGTLAFTVMARTAAQRSGRGFEAAASIARWAPLLSLAALTRLGAAWFPQLGGTALPTSGFLWSLAFLLLAAFLLAHRQPMLRADHNRSPGRRT